MKLTRKEIILAIGILVIIGLAIGSVITWGIISITQNKYPTPAHELTTIVHSGEYIKLPRGYVVYGDAYFGKKISIDHERWNIVSEEEIKTPYITKKSTFVVADSTCVIVKDDYNQAGIIIASKQTEDLIKTIYGEYIYVYYLYGDKP